LYNPKTPTTFCDEFPPICHITQLPPSTPSLITTTTTTTKVSFDDSEVHHPISSFSETERRESLKSLFDPSITNLIHSFSTTPQQLDVFNASNHNHNHNHNHNTNEAIQR
jgi:hypothetical protein